MTRALALAAVLWLGAGVCVPARASRTARVTHYFATGSPMATGFLPYVGAVACSTDIPLWSWVSIAGDVYQCLDRGQLGDGSQGWSWIDVYAVPAESLYGPWAEIEVSQ